jgi:hypothetical protein
LSFGSDKLRERNPIPKVLPEPEPLTKWERLMGEDLL